MCITNKSRMHECTNLIFSYKLKKYKKEINKSPILHVKFHRLCINVHKQTHVSEEIKKKKKHEYIHLYGA